MPATYGKYQKVEETKPAPNPIWRGVGCLLIVILPVAAYFLMKVTVPLLLNTGVVPPDIQGYVRFAPWILKTPGLMQGANFIGTINDFWLKLIVWVTLMILVGAIGSLIFTSIMQFMGPPRYREIDVPGNPYRGKKVSR